MKFLTVAYWIDQVEAELSKVTSSNSALRAASLPKLTVTVAYFSSLNISQSELDRSSWSWVNRVIRYDKLQLASFSAAKLAFVLFSNRVKLGYLCPGYLVFWHATDKAVSSSSSATSYSCFYARLSRNNGKNYRNIVWHLKPGVCWGLCAANTHTHTL